MKTKPAALQLAHECVAASCTRPRARRLHCEAHYIVLTATLVATVNTWKALQELN